MHHVQATISKANKIDSCFFPLIYGPRISRLGQKLGPLVLELVATVIINHRSFSNCS